MAKAIDAVRTKKKGSRSLRSQIHRLKKQRKNKDQQVVMEEEEPTDYSEPEPSTSSGSTNFKRLIGNISPLPVQQPETQTKSTIRKQHSIVLTTSPMRSVLVENQVRKQSKEEKKVSLEAKIRKEKKDKPGKKKDVQRTNESKGGVVKKIKLDITKMKTERKKVQLKRTYGKRKLNFDESSEDEDIGVDENELCDDNENDDNFDICGKDVEICIICNEYGINNELWYRCVSCGKWVHSECSGYDSPDNYVRDYCSL